MNPLIARAIPWVSAGGAAGFMSWAVRGKSSAVFGPSVWRGNPSRKTVALTFDDGPSEGTGQILDILARYNAPATFFQIGANVDRLPEVARAVAQAGHAIGNHSYSHPLFCFFRLPKFSAPRPGAGAGGHRAARRGSARVVPRALRRSLVRDGCGTAAAGPQRRDVDRNRL